MGRISASWISCRQYKCLTWLKPCSLFKQTMGTDEEELVTVLVDILHVVVDGAQQRWLTGGRWNSTNSLMVSQSPSLPSASSFLDGS